MNTRSLPWFGSIVAVALLGCSGDPPPPAASPEPTATAAPPPPAETATAAPTAAPAPTESPDAGAPAKPTGRQGGPAVIKSDAKEVTDSFGSIPGAKIEIGDKEKAVLKIPEHALSQATNITFKIDTKGRSGGGQIGKIYRITSVIPPASTPTNIESSGPPFELQMPAGSKKDANLAVGRVEVDDKGREKIKWEIIAPKRIDDVSNTAYFEITALGDVILHVTNKAPKK
jgi:hypothetical protein